MLATILCTALVLAIGMFGFTVMGMVAVNEIKDLTTKHHHAA